MYGQMDAPHRLAVKSKHGPGISIDIGPLPIGRIRTIFESMIGPSPIICPVEESEYDNLI